MFRSHGTDTPREVWRFGEPGTVFYDTMVKFDYLRYRLIPYIYSLAGMVTLSDYTIMRSLPFDFRHDKKTYDIGDQYMFGPAFLVNPVTEPMYYEAGSKALTDTLKARRVYLPEGCVWYDFWTGDYFDGGRTVTADAPIETMPLYVRSGSIVPMGPKAQHTTDKLDSPYELRIYGGADAEFTLYEDEGDNYNYEDGAYATVSIRWDDRSKQLEFMAREGSFRGLVKKRRFNIVLVAKGHGSGPEETVNIDKSIIYSGDHTIVDLGSNQGV